MNNSEISQIWDDSLLRHSNILGGLFHTRVVICESDSDSRFFSAVISSIHEDSDNISPDFLFLNCGGKHRVPVVIKSLKKLNVSIKVICDFDVLNDIQPLREIYTDLGGEWTDVETDWRIVKSEIEQKRPELVAEEVKTEINKIFSSTPERIFPKSKINDIQKVLKKGSAWGEAKSLGKAFVPSGNATQAFERLQSKFEIFGLLIPEVGELECFVKSVGNHGPKWVAEVLTKNLKTDPELETARLFVQKILS